MDPEFRKGKIVPGGELYDWTIATSVVIIAIDWNNRRVWTETGSTTIDRIGFGIPRIISRSDDDPEYGRYSTFGRYTSK